jgi:hypothetical protein
MSEARRDEAESDGRSTLPSGVHLPHPSIRPLTTGAGVALLLFGVIAGPLFAGAGLVTLAVGIAGWIAELHAEGAAAGDAGAMKDG